MTMSTITFNAPTCGSRTFNGSVCHEQRVKMSLGHAYEIVEEKTYTTAYNDMVESVRYHRLYIVKSRKNGLLAVSADDSCGIERPKGEVVIAP